MVAEYLGLPPAEGAGLGGNREAYYEMLEATAGPRYHSLVRGRAPDGWTLKIKKSFMTATSAGVAGRLGRRSIGAPMLFPDTLESELRSDGGRFSWHMNPSTRPVVAGRYRPRSGRAAAGGDRPGEPARACRL